MKPHADTGKRSLQLMTDRRDKIRLDLVKEPQPGDILKDHCSTKNPARIVPHSDDPREEEYLSVIHSNNNGFFETGGQIVTSALENLFCVLLDLSGEIHWGTNLMEQGESRGVREIDYPLGCQHDNRIRKGGEGALCHLASLKNLIGCHLPVGAQFCCHLVEGLREVPKLIPRAYGYGLIQFSLAEFL